MQLLHTQQLVAEQRRVLEVLQREEQMRRQNLQQLQFDSGEIEQHVVDEEEVEERRRVQEQLEAMLFFNVTSDFESSYRVTDKPKKSGACRKSSIGVCDTWWIWVVCGAISISFGFFS